MKDLLKSKKFQAAIIGVLVAILSHYVPGLPEDAANQVLTVIVAYIVGQGLADMGKERAKIEQNQNR